VGFYVGYTVLPLKMQKLTLSLQDARAGAPYLYHSEDSYVLRGNGT
jgi:hypothetical protein